VAAQLGISERSVDRLAESGHLQFRMRPRGGIRPERVYNPDQVVARLPPSPSSLVRQSAALAQLVGSSIRSAASVAESSEPQTITAVVQGLLAALKPEPIPAPPAPQPLWIGLDAASTVTGLSVTCLRKMIKAGRLNCIRDRAVKVRRSDLDKLEGLAELAEGSAS